MTKSKTQKVKAKAVDVKEKKGITEKEVNSALDGFFDQLKKVVEETADELGIHTKENHDYYVAYCYVKDGELRYGGGTYGTNINPFAKMGLGLRLIKEKIKFEKNIDGDVTILNVIKLED